ncbi:MAG TPA: AIM24 family protein [Kofleriaceae bacterium]|nr:AIM24 family protein [Kofleriaceae bacterium]
MAGYSCPFCGTASAGDSASCPGCGAPVDVQRKVTASGWIELPPAADLARIQCGRSSLQIAGTLVPVADFALAPSEGLYFAHHELLWKERQVQLQRTGMRGAWKRMLAGLPVHMLNATGPGRIALSRDAPGEMLAIPLHQGHAVEVREHVFMVATSSVTYDYFMPPVWYVTQNGDERETHFPLGMLMDRFTATGGPGLLLVHAHGNAFVRNLAAGESVLIKASALLYKDVSVAMHLHFEYVQRKGLVSWLTAGWNLQRYLWLRLTGPGRVAMQSAWGHHHDPERGIVQSTPATEHYW